MSVSPRISFCFFYLVIFGGYFSSVGAAHVKKAVARIESSDGVDGLVTFEETDEGVHVTASIDGLAVGPHGFHVHQYGDIRVLTTLDTLGYHFIYSCELVANNSCADDQTHGFPPSEVRHPGDMGNLHVAAADQPATYDEILGQQKMSLSDPLKSIVGRAVLIHQGNDTGIQPYGNAGGPAATGVIGLLNTEEDDDDINDAIGPDVPPVDKLMCVFVGDDIRGEMLITNKFSDPDLRVQLNISGLSEGDFTFALHTYGDLTDKEGANIGDVWSADSDLPTEYPFSVSAAEENAGNMGYDGTWDNIESLRSGIGRACALHKGDADGDIVAVGVIGLAHVDAELVTAVPRENAAMAHSPLSILTSVLLFLSLLRIA